MIRLVTLIFLASISFAQAGSVVITVGPTAAQRTRTWTIADGVFTARILPALKSNYGQICTPPSCRDRTNAEAFDALLLSWETSLRDIVQRYEREQGRVAADAAVTTLP